MKGMMEMVENCSKIEIKSSRENIGITEIYIDGHKIKGVRSFSLVQKSCDAPRLTLDLNAFDIAVDRYAILHQEGMGEIESITFKEGLSSD